MLRGDHLNFTRRLTVFFDKKTFFHLFLLTPVKAPLTLKTMVMIKWILVALMEFVD